MKGTWEFFFASIQKRGKEMEVKDNKENNIIKSILYGKLVSNINCDYEASLRNRKEVTYTSFHFIINYVQSNNKIYKVDKYKELERASKVNKVKVEEERLILEVSAKYKGGKLEERFKQLENIEDNRDTFFAIYLKEEPFIRKNHISKITRKVRAQGFYTIMSYFIKTWGDLITIEVMDIEEEEYLNNSSSISVCDSIYELASKKSILNVIDTSNVLSNFKEVIIGGK